MSREWRFAHACCLVVALLGVCMSIPAAAFWIAKVNPIHQNITRNGLNPYGPIPAAQLDGPKFEFQLSNGANLTFAHSVVEEISEHNVEVDEFQGFLFSERHFDSDDMAGGSRRLVQLRKEVVNTLVDASFFDFDSSAAAVERTKRSTKARLLLGEALHTLQDFYAHTNWVEMHYVNGTEIQPDLGNESIKSPFIQDECDESAPASGGNLSSGWFDEDDLPLFCQKPANKCAHGFVGSCGLNKDYPGRGARYIQARQLAIRATNVFTAETLQAVVAARTRLQPGLSAVAAQQVVNLAVCEFMGVPDPISTCITSYTMSVQKLNKANGQPTLEGLVQSTSGNLTPAIDCGLLCEGTSIAGSTVVLTAKNSGNWRFVRWAEGGACAGSTNPECSFTLTSNLFARPEFTYFDFVAVPLSPRATFLRSDLADPTLNPIVITLNELGIVPGQAIELSSSGFFSWGPPLPEDARNTNAVFSSTSELLPHTELHRVPGAIALSISGVFTFDTCASPNPLPTNIAEDFLVNNPQVVTVPTGANFLFVGTVDCAYIDNSDTNGDLVFTIRYIPD